jgi:hypothetical protein
MRRKIEKCLAKKREIDESEVQPEPDGRFDLEGDFEGVLASIRGKDGMVNDTKTIPTRKAIASPRTVTRTILMASMSRYWAFSRAILSSTFCSNRIFSIFCTLKAAFAWT